MKNNIAYKPIGLWHEYDFLINKFFWIKTGYQAAYKIRERNIKDVREILEKSGVKNFLFGKTLKGMVETNDIPDDHDDDFGVFFEDREKIRTILAKQFIDNNFQIIRDTEDMISVERDYRYIDICFFRKFTKNKLGYSDKRCDAYHFDFFEKKFWRGVEFDIPNNSHKLLHELYSSLNSFFLKKIKKIDKVKQYVKNKMINLIYNTPSPFFELMIIIVPFLGVKSIELSEEEFLNIFIEPSNSFNWKWRARHLDLVTNRGTNKSIKDIVLHLSDKSVVCNIENNIEETDTSKPFCDPANLDMDFWWNGNNYFFYCIKYQFRKNVVPYINVNDYIKAKRKPYLYTANYYESLAKMSEYEIQKFLYKHPIEIENNAVVGGKHRVFAMIGRLIEGKKYIPMRAFIKIKDLRL